MSSYTAGDLPYFASGTAFSKLTVGNANTVLTSTGSAPQWSTNLNFAALVLSGNLTLNGGTANGVLYLNGSKVATSGSALVFDGTNLGIGTTSPASALQVQRASANPTVNITRTTTSAQTLGESLYLRLNDTVGNSPRTEIGMGYGIPGTTTYTPAIIGYVQTSSSGQTYGDLYFATRTATTDTAPTERMRLDSSGNLGLGVTPSAWFSASRVYQFGSGGALEGRTNESQYLALTANQYIDSAGAFKYIGSTFASRYQQYNGAHSWSTAASGTAGNTITFTQAMTLDAGGRLYLGVVS